MAPGDRLTQIAGHIEKDNKMATGEYLVLRSVLCALLLLSAAVGFKGLMRGNSRVSHFFFFDFCSRDMGTSSACASG